MGQEQPWKIKSELESPISPFAPVEKSSFVPQVPKVNLVTGEYCEESCDLVVAGIEPLSIRRFYNHIYARQEQIYGHWRINPETFVLFNFENEFGFPRFLGIGEANSNFLLYDRVGNDYVIRPQTIKSFMSTSLSGQTHPLNHRMTYSKKERTVRRSVQCVPEDHCWWEGVIRTGDGSERSFRTDVRQWPQEGQLWPCSRRIDRNTGEVGEVRPLEFSPPYQALVTEERRPNGNIIRYEYVDFNASSPWIDRDLPTNYMLKSMKAYSSKGVFLGGIDLTYTSQFPHNTRILLIDHVKFQGSDGRELHFSQPQRFIKKGYVYDTILTYVTAAGKPEQRYDYRDCRNKKRTDYATPPYLYKVFQKEKEGWVIETAYDGSNRVSTQSAPVGPNGKMVPISRYTYDSDHTIVYDAEDNKTVYRFNSDKRIIAIEKFQGEILYSVERQEWDSNSGNLLKKKVEDASGKIFYDVTYVYDKNHNVIEERVEGAHPIFRTYSDDGFNLKLSESDRPNKEIRYTYVPRTHLLSSEIMRLNGEIAKRTFHFYDEEITSVCVKTIIDDGKTENPNDKAGVTFRHVKEISPKRTLPCLGLPEEIREYAGEELIKKVRYTYHPSGKITSEEHYDAENKLRHTLRREYDHEERLISSTDSLGNKTIFAYDCFFNLISQTGPRPDQHKEWQYDLMNRPVKEMEWQSDGTILTSERKYDKASRVIADVDPSGFETRYTYDALGRVVAVHYPDGAVERRTYDILGNVIQEIDPNGYGTRKSYNFRGQVTNISHPDGTEEHFTYNKEGGTLASHIDPHGVTIFCTYDLLNNLIRTESEGAVTLATYTPFRLISETDPLGVTTFVNYDLIGRKVAEQKGDREKQWRYNALGQIAQVQEGDVTTLFFYDLKGQIVEKRIEGAFQEKYRYDEAGNKTETTTCLGTQHATYNSRGEPLELKNPLGHITTFSYSYLEVLPKPFVIPRELQQRPARL